MPFSRSSFVHWRVPAALLLLGAVPMVAGASRVSSLALGAPVTGESARFVASPTPVVLHVLGALALGVLGAFQLVPELRRRRPVWHRTAGRVALTGGIAAGLSGLWMTVFYPAQPHDGTALLALRLFFGTAMVACLGMGFVAARRRRFDQHGAWMVRAYAIGMGAGTQALLHLLWLIFLPQPAVASRAFLMGAGWILNLGVAEWVLKRQMAFGRIGAGTPRQTYLDSSSPPAAQSR